MINKFLEELEKQNAPANAIKNFNLDLEGRPLPGLDRAFLVDILKERLLMSDTASSETAGSMFEIFALDLDSDFMDNIQYLVELSLSLSLLTIEDELFEQGMNLNEKGLFAISTDITPDVIDF